MVYHKTLYQISCEHILLVYFGDNITLNDPILSFNISNIYMSGFLHAFRLSVML
ncbi:hypothetical protein Lalb_Chr04g0249491 [Lupinus albus]|uniref:Uncharacterized protein n=1 Tax=Lupinus albus TaxID=3870 RepID=A0A6A4QN59_LUPAL|nr:hypothetical protein Lalb_Chr04g0249491 [Lupinus albus]